MNRVPTSASQQPSSSSSKLLTLVGIVVVIAGLYLGRPVLIPLALALVLAFLLSPIVGFLEKSRLGRVTSVLTVLVMSFALLGGVGWTVTGQITQILEQVPDYRANIHDKIVLLRESRDNSLTRATTTVNDLGKELSAASETAANKKAGKNSATPPIAVQK
jgi:predicted PurR-regulated permease PerM